MTQNSSRTSLLDRFAGVAAIESRHHLVTRAQLEGLHISGHQIAWLHRAGVITRVAHGLYYTQGRAVSWLARAEAALSTHHRAVLSHGSAAALHGFDVQPPLPPVVTLTGPAAPGRSSVATVRRSPVDRGHRTRRLGLDVTTAARTLVDLSRDLSGQRFVEVVDDALCRNLTTATRAWVAANATEHLPGRIGHAQLRSVLGPWLDGLVPESVAEMRLLRLIAERGLPMPETQIAVLDPDGSFVARIDAGWRSSRQGLEYDSDRWHPPRRWEHDDERLEQLRQRGWDVRRIGAPDLRPSRLGWLADLAVRLRTERLAA